MRDLIKTVPSWLKFAVALGAAAAALLSLGADWYDLPAQVRENTDSLRAHTSYIRADALRERATDARYDRIICLLTLPAGTTPLQAEEECQ